MSAPDLLTKGLGFGNVSLLITQGLGQDAEEQQQPEQPTAPRGGADGTRRRSTQRPHTFAEAEAERRLREREAEARRQRIAAELERQRQAEAARPAKPPAAPVPLRNEAAELFAEAARQAWERRAQTLAAAQAAREAERRAQEARAAAEAARLKALERDEEEALIMLIALAA